ncbi:MAG: hypothetical protein PHW93_01865 [Candidatus Methanomethylophilaceae archaeon]|nr:hypothetical protein [Candidatus Methanomethylophilaceae archaeon]
MSDDHDELHLEMHRAIDQLGKYAIKLQLDFGTGKSKSDIKSLINEVMMEVTDRCMQHGADVIGHVKSFLVAPEGNLMSSIVEHGESAAIKDGLKADSLKGAEFILHVIVHGIWDDEVREQTLEFLEEVMPRYGVSYKILDDYYEVEKGMDHHN